MPHLMVLSSGNYPQDNMTEYTVPEAAAYLGVAEETVRRHLRAKRLPAIKRGTQWFILLSSLQAFASSYDRRTGRRE